MSLSIDRGRGGYLMKLFRDLIIHGDEDRVAAGVITPGRLRNPCMLVHKVSPAVLIGFLGCCWQSIADHNPTAAAQPVSGVSKSRPTDCYGDLLPPGAVSRLGTIRLRHPGGAGALAFSPDNELLASGTGHSVRLWELKTGKELHEFASVSASCLAFSPDGKTLASGEWEGEIIF